MIMNFKSVLAVAAGCLAGCFVNASVHASVIVLQDDFESYTGDAAIRAVWDSSSYPGATNPIVRSNLSNPPMNDAHSGVKVMGVETNGRAGVHGIGGPYSTGKTIDFTSYIWSDPGATGNQLRVQLGDDTNNYDSYEVMVGFKQGSQLLYSDGATTQTASSDTPIIQAETWYKLRIVATPNLGGTSVADIYLDDNLIAQDIHFVNNTPAISTVRFGAYGNPTGGENGEETLKNWYIDDVMVQVSSVPEPAGISMLMGAMSIVLVRRSRH